MPVKNVGTADLARVAYEVAWREFVGLTGLTSEEMRTGSNQLRWYIRLMTTVGERDPSKIARSALGMTRQYEQITRSKARVAPTIPQASR
jgi:hypothetical protein